MGIAGVGQLAVAPSRGSTKTGGAGSGDVVGSELAGDDVSGTRAVDAGDEARPGVSESDEGPAEVGGCDHTGVATTVVSALVVVVVVETDP